MAIRCGCTCSCRGVSTTLAATFCEGLTLSAVVTLRLDSVVPASARDTSCPEPCVPRGVETLGSEVLDNANSISEIANSIFSRRMSASSISAHTSCSLVVASRISASSPRMIVSLSFSVRSAKLSLDFFLPRLAIVRLALKFL